ncbi:MAG TPA: ABC transporter permease, partial [Gemmatimonadaceae bacterium]|nr:ABC transporter permease [Gemmatimonadaceae bacterium]
MSLIDSLRYRLRVWLRPRAHERELAEEIRFHLSLESMQREHGARGALSATDAGWVARRRFGNVTTTMEEARQMAGLGFFDTLEQDVRFALRSFRRSPGFTAVAVVTLAVGIGANTAIFSAVDAMLLRPLPFREPERLMTVNLTVPPQGDRPAWDSAPWSYPKYVVFRDAQTLYERVGLWTDMQATVRVGTDAERAGIEIVDGEYLPTLGITPAIGRNFTREESAQPGGPRVAILSDAFWQRRFNADSSVLGRTVDLDGTAYMVVGVLPRGFRGLSGEAELFVPVVSRDAEMLTEVWSHAYWVIARLKPGVSPSLAKTGVRQLGERVADAFPPPRTNERWGAIARELDHTRVDPVVRRSLLVLLGAVGLVLLIACANVANLFLVRAAGRHREMAVRLAVGAGRRRLVRQLVTESVVLSVLGGVASLAVAWWGVKVLAALDPSATLRVQLLSGLGALSFESIRLDVKAFAFAAAVAGVTGLVFGLVPALHATRPSLTGALKSDGERLRLGGVRGITSRNVLAIVEIALAVVLLAGS